MIKQFWRLYVGYMTIFKKINLTQQYAQIWECEFALSELLGITKGKKCI